MLLLMLSALRYPGTWGGMDDGGSPILLIRCPGCQVRWWTRDCGVPKEKNRRGKKEQDSEKEAEGKRTKGRESVEFNPSSRDKPKPPCLILAEPTEPDEIYIHRVDMIHDPYPFNVLQLRPRIYIRSLPAPWYPLGAPIIGAAGATNNGWHPANSADMMQSVVQPHS